MSTPKKVRETYEKAFQKLISTSEGSKKLRQFLGQIKNPATKLNLPIKLSDLEVNFSLPLKKPTRQTSTPRGKPPKTMKLNNHPPKKLEENKHEFSEFKLS